MRRLIFINRFFFPDHSATSQILSDLAFYLAGAARDVHIVTSRQIYDDPKASLPADETIQGVHVHRVHSTQFGRSGLVGRSIDYFSFYRSVWRCLRGIARQDDIVVAKTDPPLLSIVAMAAVRRRGARLVNWLQDIYPELAVELGVPFIRGPVASGLAAARNRSLRLAEATVAVGDLMGQKVVALGASPARVHIIPNWCDDEAIKPLSETRNPLREAWGLQEKFVVGYSGNLGRAHDFATVLAAAERLRDDRPIVFLMIGGGRRFDDLARTVKERGLDASFRFVAYQERAMLAYSLGVPDVHWLSLNPSLEGLIVPSKFYGIAAAGKPIIVIGANDGELARLVRKHECGIVIAPGDGVALAATVSRLANNPASVAELGAQARRMLEMHFTRQQAFERWHRLLEALDQQLEPPA
ncbi:MAG TPA: glycosyltransferase family 4 protein [Steroidobacteraceae bacterium]|jgi:glycosyltransferase involved in cell wall biosynthesis|nr:glycosyltransferase family 4 protein [Steroidobacteraceae bacterium]